MCVGLRPWFGEAKEKNRKKEVSIPDKLAVRKVVYKTAFKR